AVALPLEHAEATSVTAANIATSRVALRKRFTSDPFSSRNGLVEVRGEDGFLAGGGIDDEPPPAGRKRRVRNEVPPVEPDQRHRLDRAARRNGDSRGRGDGELASVRLEEREMDDVVAGGAGVHVRLKRVAARQRDR